MEKQLDKKVKIICTIGPASQSILPELVQAGMDVARLNFSHGDHAFHQKTIEHLKTQPVTILQDLQGPKLRVGKLPQDLFLKAGESAFLFPEESKVRHPATYHLPLGQEISEALLKEVKKKDRFFFDDGKIQAIATKCSSEGVWIEILKGGLLKSHKGLNLPDTPLESLGCLLEKDLHDLAFGLSHDVDAIALSFVRCAKDVKQLRKKLHQAGKDPLIFSKIERPEAVHHPDPIFDASDGILIARGDMAVEVGAEHVPIIQKKLIQKAHQKGLPVITATQMLESMITQTTPTRAEANDVANAVFDGTDGVMLSAESASGNYPVKTVQTMARILSEAQKHLKQLGINHVIDLPRTNVVEAIEQSAAKIAEQIGAAAIVCLTHSGHAAQMLSKYRPTIPIVAIVNQPHIYRRLGFFWGVHRLMIDKIVPTDAFFLKIDSLLKSHGWAKKGQKIVLTAGIPTLKRGTTNTIHIHQIT